MKRFCSVAAVMVSGVACSDYQLEARKSPQTGAQDDQQDVAPDDTGAAFDTGDSGDPSDSVPVETAKAPTYVNTAYALYSWEPGGSLELVAGFWISEGDVPQITDIAIDSDGYMYGCSFDTLYRIHAETGQLLPIASLGIYMAGLTFVGDGQLVGAGEGVYLIDPSNGAVTTLVEPGRYVTSGDIIGLPDGLLYWTVRGDSGEADSLIVVDPATGRTVDRGDTEVFSLFGLGYADDTLFGFTDEATVVRLDPDFGGSSDERPLGAGGWWGATTNPVRW